MTKGDYFLLEEWCYQHEVAGDVRVKDLLKFCRKFLIDETQIPYDLKEYYKWVGSESYRTETELESEKHRFDTWLENEFERRIEEPFERKEISYEQD